MKLADVLKTSLDELRMQMLGTQVLLGFQFQGVFQDNFKAVGLAGQVADATGMGLLVMTLGLIMAVPCQHRLVEGGEDTVRIYRTSKRYAELALVPLAGGVGCNLFVATRAEFGATTAATAALTAFGSAAAVWYVLARILRRYWAVTIEGDPVKEGQTPLHSKIEQMLTEGRVILPGVQALLGFQFVVMLTKGFGELPPVAREVHLAALLSLTLTIILLIAPAAIHRLTFNGNDDQRMHQAGSRLMTVALLPLAFGLSCDIWVVLTKMFTEHAAMAAGGAAAVFLILISLWYGVPLALRRAHAGGA
jgi:hypothetical protein